MEYDIDVSAIKGIISHFLGKIFIIHIIIKGQPLKIAAFTAICQVINDKNVINSTIIQLFYNIAADKAGAACYNFHKIPFFTKSAILLTSPVVEYPSSKEMISTRLTNSRPTTSSAL